MAFFKSGDDAKNGENKPVTLSGLYGMVEDAQKQIAEYLLNREAEFCGSGGGSSGGEAVAGGAMEPRAIAQLMAPVIDRLDAIGEMLASGGGGGAVTADTGTLEKLVTERFNRLEGFLTGNPPAALEGAEPAAVKEESPQEYEHYQEPRQQAPQQYGGGRGGDDAAWEEAVFGPYLSGHPALAAYRQSLLQGIRHGDMNSRYFAGVLMMFQAAAPEKMVLLLKDLGEAYYRWSPKRGIDPDAMEVSLRDFAIQACERAGLPNSIELVHPGQRFDSGRHNATSRGVEIVNVLGWVVLRGNGSVYSKAAVDVQ